MKVLQYNVLDGIDSKERLANLEAWISGRGYDVAGFNELNGWNQQRFQEAGERWGFPYTYIFEAKRSPYRIGIMAKTPIEHVRSDEEHFHHGLVHVVIRGIHFLVTHLSPHSSQFREREAAHIARRIAEIDAPVMLMGDLNTLSPLDHRHYLDIGLAEHFVQIGRDNHFHRKGVLNYRPMSILLAAGLHDTAADEPFLPTVPTTLLHPEDHVPKLRIDYLLANDQLLQRSPKSRILHGEEVELLSDHYPIECEWEDD